MNQKYHCFLPIHTKIRIDSKSSSRQIVLSSWPQ